MSITGKPEANAALALASAGIKAISNAIDF